MENNICTCAWDERLRRNCWHGKPYKTVAHESNSKYVRIDFYTDGTKIGAVFHAMFSNFGCGTPVVFLPDVHPVFDSEEACSDSVYAEILKYIEETSKHYYLNPDDLQVIRLVRDASIRSKQLEIEI